MNNNPKLSADEIGAIAAKHQWTITEAAVEDILAAAARAAWAPAAPGTLPDSDITVDLALSDGDVWEGYLDGETWRDVSGMPITSARVMYWAHKREHPEPAAKAAPMRTSTGLQCGHCCAKAGEAHAPGCPELQASRSIETWHTGLPLPGEEGGAQ